MNSKLTKILFAFTFVVILSGCDGGSSPVVVDKNSSDSNISKDTTKPTLKVLGDNPQQWKRGLDYKDAGAVASDNVDGNLTSSITVDTSSVDTSTDGNYTVTYSVSDSAGNSATATREVVILQSPIKKTGQTVCFDDRNASKEIDCKDTHALKSDGYYQKGVTLRYTRDDTKEVVVDKITGLMWQDNAEAKIVEKNWDDAKSYCQNLTLGGFTDWRLSNIKELKSIINREKANPAIDSEFSNVASDDYWSSSNIGDRNDLAWYVWFYDGCVNDHGSLKSNSRYVRCVRDNN